MVDRLQGKVAVITGAGMGMGRAFARRLAAEGAKVAVLDISAGSAQETARLIEAEGGVAKAYTADVSDEQSVREVAQAVVADFKTVTTLVNNAGILDGFAGLADTEPALWDQVMSIDLKGVYLITRAFLPHLKASGDASVVNLSSVAGLRPGGGGLTYSTAKTAVNGLTRMMQAEVGPEIRCNAILPGVIGTPMVEKSMADPISGPGIKAAIEATPSKRLGTPEDVANVVLFLASDESSFLYGSELVVDGGWMLR